MARSVTVVRSDWNLETLRRWLAGEDVAFDEWLAGRVRRIHHRRRRLAAL